MGRSNLSRRTGFTLTELLIVILIIVVLIGLLMPAIHGARTTARKSASSSFMNEILGASAQFQAAERRLPGYFSVRDLGGVDNYAKSFADNKTGGFTQMESALIDLAGGIDPDQSRASVSSPLYDPNTEQAPDRIIVGPWTASDTRSVVIRRSAIGAADGPGYLAMPDQFVDPGSANSGQVGSPSGRLMPDLIDAFGMPILMWQRDSLSPQGSKVYVADQSPPTLRFPNESADPHFYLNTNVGMLHASNLGKGVGRSQYNYSCLSWSQPSATTTNTKPQALRTLEAIVGHPAFPNAGSLNDNADGPIPAQPRGDIILHSAGPDGIYAQKRRDVITRIQYVPEGYSGPLLTNWLGKADAAGSMGGERLEKFDDMILPGG